MTEDELKALEKEVKKLKRIASEHASQLHDLVEDRLPAAWRDIPRISEETLVACKAWEEATERLKAAEGAQA